VSSSPPHLSDRLALRPKEVAAVLGVSERHIRQHLHELPHLRLGDTVLIPVDLLREHLRERAQTEESGGADAVEQVLQQLDLE
jgi:excisionase family DNA binding protein